MLGLTPLLFVCAQTLSLGDFVERVLAHGPQSAAVLAQTAVAASNITTAGMVPNPTLAMEGVTIEPIFASYLQLTLPFFGMRGARIAAAEQGVRQTEASVRQQLWAMRREARVAYFFAARADAEVTIGMELLELTAKVALIADSRVEAGSASRLEKQLSTLARARARQDVADRKSAARRARLDLVRLLGSDEAVDCSLTDPLERAGDTPALDALLDESKRKHPELQTALLAKQTAEAQAHSARIDLIPQPTLRLGLDLLEASTCGGSSRCVRPFGWLLFDLPIFNVNQGPVARAEAEAQRQMLIAAALAVQIETRVRSAHEAWLAANARARFFDEEYVPVAIAVEAMTREGFQSGKSNLNAVLDATRGVLEAQSGRAGAYFAKQLARAELEEVSGVSLSLP